jgi:hypothetical protein
MNNDGDKSALRRSTRIQQVMNPKGITCNPSSSPEKLISGETRNDISKSPEKLNSGESGPDTGKNPETQ